MSSFEEAEFWVLPKDIPNLGMTMITGKEILKTQQIKDISKDEWSYHFWYGISLGYPLCCILWFCDVWDKEKGNIKDLMDNNNWKHNIGYIQCPNCVSR